MQFGQIERREFISHLVSAAVACPLAAGRSAEGVVTPTSPPCSLCVTVPRDIDRTDLMLGQSRAKKRFDRGT
jgi:hypothetical protein